jgi:exosome complex exonuclease RRP6
VASATAPDIAEDQPVGLSGQIEIPYIPAAQRQQTNIVDDSIVVVGRARQKKRKRLKSSSANDTEPGSAKRSAVDAEISAEARQLKALKRKEQHEEGSVTPQEPFDYSAVPNLLDDVPTPEYDMTSRKKKKQKQNKGTHLRFAYQQTTHL